jgi:1-acyl-sn-glycerol-3-phosphate acyltransferase
MLSLLRRLYRLSLLLVLAVAGLLTQVLLFPLLGSRARRRIIRGWSRALLVACGLQLRVSRSADADGTTATADTADSAGSVGSVGSVDLERLAPGRMLVSNHVSWLDIFAVDALAPASFVAKAELRSWPLAGWLAAMAGTLFIERGRRRAVHQVIEQLRRRIREGYPVALFPEATTSPGLTVLPFHANLLEAAILEEAEIVPIVLRYLDSTGALAAQAAYVGDTTFMQSLWMVLGARGLVVTVVVLRLVPSRGRNRHELAGELSALISAGLVSPPPGRSPGTAAAFQAASR